MNVTPFSIPATTLSTTDTSPYTLIDWDSTKSIYIPKYVELFKEANPAATLTSYGDVRISPRDHGLDSYSDQFAGGPNIQIEIVDSSGRGRVLFSIPAEGFLDSATEQRRVSFAKIDGATFKPGPTIIRLRMGCQIASSECKLDGRLFFDTVTVGGF